MNNGELKQMLLNYSHREDLGDLTGQVQSFINGATEMINNRFETSYGDMSNDTDSNPVLANHGRTLYFPAAMRFLSKWIKDWDEAIHFDDLFNKAADRMNITNMQGIINQGPLHIKSEQELLAEEQANDP